MATANQSGDGSATCPLCGDYEGEPSSVEAHISRMTDPVHQGEVGRAHRDDLERQDHGDQEEAVDEPEEPEVEADDYATVDLGADGGVSVDMDTDPWSPDDLDGDDGGSDPTDAPSEGGESTESAAPEEEPVGLPPVGVTFAVVGVIVVGVLLYRAHSSSSGSTGQQREEERGGETMSRESMGGLA